MRESDGERVELRLVMKRGIMVKRGHEGNGREGVVGDGFDEEG